MDRSREKEGKKKKFQISIHVAFPWKKGHGWLNELGRWI